MKPIFLVLAWCCLLFPTVAHGNGDRTQKLVFSLSNNSVDDLSFSTVPCNSPGSDLAITDAEGELPMTGDNDPSNGAFMRWTATGGTGLYFSQIYQGGELYTIEDPGTGFTVFTANNGINFDEEVAISVELGGVCITPGFWTIRVWEVSDADNDRQPDRDVNGEILGCFVETTIEFFPSCPQLGTNVPFTVDPQDIGCNGTGGTIGLLNFQQDLMYCVDNNGGGATFDWVGPDGFTATTRDVANLVPGIYTVEVKDFYGCTFRWSREIVDLDNLAFDCRIVDSLSVFGASDAVIEVETTAGSGDYELSWTGPSSGNRPNIGPGPQTIENLPAGLYRFYVTDNISTCVDSCTVEIPVPPCLIDFTVVYDEMSQTVIVTPVDGTADFFLSYFGPTEAENIGPFGFEGIVLPESDFLLGNYVFVLSEANRPDCALSQTFFIPPECHIEAVVSASQPTCSGDSDGSIALTVTDNLGPITYNWDNDAFDGLDSVGNLAAGTYTVRISDSAECYLAPQVVVLADPPPVRVTILQVETGCSGEPTNALLATHSGAVGTVSYNWSVSAADTNRIEGLAVGNYSVTVTDENSCVGVGSFEVIDPAPLTMNCSAMDESIVGTFDGTITIQHSGGIPGVILSGDLGTFPLRPNVDTVFTGLAPGTYSFLLTNPNGCFTNCTAVVGPGQCVLEVSILPTQPDCNTATGSALAQPLNDNGPLAYTWSSGDSTAAVTGLLPGDYFLTVTDTFNCEATAMVTIEPFTDFPVVSFNMPTEACPNGCTEIEFTLSGLPPFLITYEVDRPGGPNVTGNFQLSASGIREFCPGEFGYTSLEGVNIFFRDITDGNGCRRRVNRLASINTYPIIVGQLDTTLCPGDTLDYFGTLFHENQLGAEVALPFPSSNGCDTSTAVSVTFFAPALGALDTTICLGDTLRYFDQVFHANRTTDDVVLPIPSSNGCDTTVRVSLDFFAPVSGTLDTMLCFGDTLRYGNEIFHASRPFGRVVLPGASSNGCDSTLNINLSFFPPARGNLNTTICANDTLRYFGEEFHLGRRFGEVLITGVYL
ncbi:MAG: SprB repeat-containing protein [Bacteroidota bacterium]